MCATVWRRLVKVTEVTAGLVEGNGSLPLGEWLKITCGLSACTPRSAPGPTLGNEYGRTLPLPYCQSLDFHHPRIRHFFSMRSSQISLTNSGIARSISLQGVKSDTGQGLYRNVAMTA